MSDLTISATLRSRKHIYGTVILCANASIEEMVEVLLSDEFYVCISEILNYIVSTNFYHLSF